MISDSTGLSLSSFVLAEHEVVGMLMNLLKLQIEPKRSRQYAVSLEDT